jgi:OmcA/MtrC family decaheme c-type cytochrome
MEDRMNTGMKRAVIVMLTAALLAVSPLVAQTAGRSRSAAPPAAKEQPRFGPLQVEAFASASDLAFIRPGLKIIVNSVTIGSDRKVVVDFNLTDSLDQPIDRLGKTTPGPVSVSFVLSWYDPATRQYTSYNTRIQTGSPTSAHPGATASQAAALAGAIVDLETGHAKFTSTTVLPAGFDQTKTTTLGIYSTRNLTAVVGIDPALQKSYFANAVFDFRPDGGTVTDKWDKMRESTTCNTCHDPLGAHGGSRQQIKLCVLCHQPQSTDANSGNTVDMKVMAHKIHMGNKLPSVLAGTPYGVSSSDFSTVVWPQMTQGKTITNCALCHEGTSSTNVGAQSAAWYTNPSRAACGSCHDDVDWVTGANHPAGPQADDKACAACHQPDGLEFDASIKGAHTVWEKSKQLKGLKATVVSVTNMTPGKHPTAVFKLTNTDGSAVDGTKLTTFAPILAGPTSSYSKYYRESALTTAVFNATAGTTSYTFTAIVPTDATGTWTVSGDIYRNATLVRGDGKANMTMREAAVNPVQYVAVTGPVTPRRVVVALANCTTCHDGGLSLHGGQRVTTLECVICHNPTEGDQSLRPASLGPAESVSFQRMIHRIHTGDNLTQDYTIIGFGGSTNNFNDVRFPGDTRNCAKCHSGNTFTLPLAQTGIASVTTLRDYFTPQGPATAACLGCHDSKDTAAHAYLNSVTFPGTTILSEACATCHGAGKDWAVDKVHAR